MRTVLRQLWVTFQTHQVDQNCLACLSNFADIAAGLLWFRMGPLHNCGTASVAAACHVDILHRMKGVN